MYMMNTIFNIFVLEQATEDVEIASHSNTRKVQSSTGVSIKQGDDFSETATASSNISDCLQKTEISFISTGKLK